MVPPDYPQLCWKYRFFNLWILARMLANKCLLLRPGRILLTRFIRCRANIQKNGYVYCLKEQGIYVRPGSSISMFLVVIASFICIHYTCITLSARTQAIWKLVLWTYVLRICCWMQDGCTGLTLLLCGIQIGFTKMPCYLPKGTILWKFELCCTRGWSRTVKIIKPCRNVNQKTARDLDFMTRHMGCVYRCSLSLSDKNIIGMLKS